MHNTELNIELKIRDLLIKQKTSQERHAVIEAFLEIEDLHYQDKRQLAVFFVNTGYYKSFLELCLRDLKKKEELFWSLLSETLIEMKVPVSTKVKKSILKGAFREKKLSDLGLSPRAIKWGNLFQKNRKKQFDFIEKAYKKSREKIKKRIKYFQSSGLAEQTIALIDQELKDDPKNQELLEQKVKIKELMAEEVFDQHKFFSLDQFEVKKKPQTQEEKNVLKLLRKEMKQHSSTSIEKKKNMALFFHFIEDHPAALSTLQGESKDLSIQWLKIEILLLFEKYLDALSEVKKIEKKHSKKSEALFASCYIKSLCYWGLNEKEKAIDTLKQLLEIKPNYRSAHALLKKWEALV